MVDGALLNTFLHTEFVVQKVVGKCSGVAIDAVDANAIAIATVDNISLACVHAEPVSQWKGFSPGMTGMRAIYAASLAKRGFEGPSGLLEGPDGLERMFGQPIHVDWDDPSLEIVNQTVLKKYCSLIHGQPVLEAVLDLKRGNGLVAANIKRVHCDVFQGAFDFAGGGRYGSKDHPQAKEQADYNLKYLVAAALLDNQVGPNPVAAGTHSGAGRAGAARTSGGSSRRAVHRPLSQRTQCPNHHPYQRPAGSGEKSNSVGREV